MLSLISYIVWDPTKEIFRIPIIDHPVVWYGLLFASAFLIGQQIILRIFKAEGKPESDIDTLTMYMVIATVVGARLGHVFFYEPARYLANPIDILKVWEGGLASHGATVGILLALYLYSRKKNDQSYLWVLDRLVIVIALAAVLIRTGNFVNSEIIGKPTGTETGVVFARDIEELIERSGGDLVADAEASASSRAEDAQPGEVPIKLLIIFERGVDESQAKGFLEKTVKRALLSRSADLEPHVSEPSGVPLNYSLIQEKGTITAVVNTLGITRHPAQLYEAINCVVLFIILMFIWNKYREKSPEGLIFGIFLIQLFGFRFIDEFFKENQVAFEADIPLNMGQWLSIPLVIAGVLILLRLVVRRNTSGL